MQISKNKIIEPAITRNHTERLLDFFVQTIDQESRELTIPGDLSSAAFFIVLATLKTQSDLLIKNVGINPTRMGVVNILKLMGANIVLENQHQVFEPVADIRVKSARLHGVEIPSEQISLAIDEFPILFIAAALAKGRTVLRNASELRVKESDRIAVMAAGLQQLGIEVEVFADGLAIQGGEFNQAASIDSHGDHRVAMAFLIAKQLSKHPISVLNTDCINTSFPGFSVLLRGLFRD